MNTDEEKPIVHIDHRLYHNEPRIVLDSFDLGDLPRRVRLSKYTIRGFDGVLREFRRPPSKWLNHWIEFGYLPEPVPVLFDVGGHSYIIVPSKLKPEISVKILIHEEGYEDVLERLEVATDFCDYCGHPLRKNCDNWLEHDGETIADVFDCPSCEMENIRWDKAFIEWHPILEDLNLKTRD